MSTPHTPHLVDGQPDPHLHARLVELLGLEASGDLSPDERAEFDRLAVASPHACAAAERTFTALELAALDVLDELTPPGTPRKSSSGGAGAGDPVPGHLRAALLSQAGPRDQAAPTEAAFASTATPFRSPTPNPTPRGALPAEPPGVLARIGRAAPWLAAAAAITFATFVWISGPATPPAGPALNQQVALIDRAADAVRLAFKPGVPELGAAKGEIVWSDAQQRGYLRLTGVTPNDPSARQFQLWIVDPARDARPIDGGVFDVASSGEVIIPVSSKLAVSKPAAFAITAEKPGGVVVSGGPMLLIASRS